jgi:hypothetical protein
MDWIRVCWRRLGRLDDAATVGVGMCFEDTLGSRGFLS